MNDKSKKIGSIFGIFLILGSVVFAPMGVTLIGTVSASHNCSSTDHTVRFLTFAAMNDHCATSHADELVNQVQNAEDSQVKIGIYNTGLSQASSIESFHTVVRNYLTDSEAAAWTHVEEGIARSYRNDTIESVTKSNAKQTIRDYYAVKQKNLLAQFESSMRVLWTMHQKAKNESGVNNKFVNFGYTTTGNSYVGHTSVNQWKYVNATVTLTNGSTVEVKTVGLDVTIHGVNEDMHYPNVTVLPQKLTTENSPGNGDPRPFYLDYSSSNGFGEVEFESIRVNAPNSDFSRHKITNLQKWAKLWNNINTKQNNVNEQVEIYVNKSYDAYASGKLNASDVLSRITLMTQYGAQATENSTYANVIAALSASGLSTPSINGTGTMTITYNNQKMNGMLFSTVTPESGAWETGTTYNADTINGTQLWISTTGTKTTLQGNFTLTEITNTDGDNVKNVTVKEYNYRTSNTSELLEKMGELSDLRQEIEAMKIQASGGGGGGGNKLPPWLTNKIFGIPVYGYIIVMVLIAYMANAVRGE